MEIDLSASFLFKIPAKFSSDYNLMKKTCVHHEGVKGYFTINVIFEILYLSQTL